MPWKAITALIAISAVLIVAILNGIDGALLASGLAVLGGLGGWIVRSKTHL